MRYRGSYFLVVITLSTIISNTMNLKNDVQKSCFELGQRMIASGTAA